MAIVEELVAAGTAALQLPRVLLRRGCSAVRQVAEGGERQPVLLIHGYAGTESVWGPLRRQLAAAGFGHVVSLSYNSFATDPVRLGAEVAAQAELAIAATGADGVHLVGHSLGGLLARYAVQRHGLADVASTVVTIAAPHGGIRLARLAPGGCARLMLPGSPLLAAGSALAPASRARWLAYYSDGDRVVPAWSAQLTDRRLGATNLLVPSRGHLTICRDPWLVASVVGQLTRTESEQSAVRRQPASAA